MCSERRTKSNQELEELIQKLDSVKRGLFGLAATMLLDGQSEWADPTSRSPQSVSFCQFLAPLCQKRAGAKLCGLVCGRGE